MRSRPFLSAAIGLTTAAVTVAFVALSDDAPAFDVERSVSLAASSSASPTLDELGLIATRADDPARTVVEDADGNWVATFTDGARTVALAGPERRFDESSATDGVTSTTWVRLLDEPFAGSVDARWLDEARTDADPDVLAIAAEYLTGAPDVVGTDGLLRSADASYGPLQPDGDRPVGSDWNDFQQVEATYGDSVDEPEPDEARALDCSGYLRMVFGVRSGLPMGLDPDGGSSLPRRSMDQAAEAPGVTPIPDTGEQVTDLGRLQPGDLVFFDTPSEDDGVIDHTGIYLGLDDAGHHRFIHSRRSTDGPTLGDDEGPSIIDGDGYFARGFVATRRL